MDRRRIWVVPALPPIGIQLGTCAFSCAPGVRTRPTHMLRSRSVLPLRFAMNCSRFFRVLVGAFTIFAFAFTAFAQGPAGRHPTPRDVEVRAIYFTGLMAGSPHGRQIAQAWRAEGGNAVVFDVKDSDGPVSFNANLPLAGHLKHPYIKDLPEWIGWLHQHGLYAIARIAVFKDERLVHEHPELAVHSRSNGGVWLENGKAAWTDPSLPAVQNYNIELAEEVANAGADEIQFDYIRFPVDGNQKDAHFAYQASNPGAARATFISNFLYRAQQALKPSGVHISI